MATRARAGLLVQQILGRPSECVADILRHTTLSCNIDVPYNHIWVSYVVSRAGLGFAQAPLTASCDKGANWFRRRKRYKLGQAYGGGYIPYPGDYIYCSSTYEQADATDVGIVLFGDETFIRFVHWEDGCPKEVEWYSHDPRIIGYGIPEYEDAAKVEKPMLATKGDAVAIAGEDTYVYVGPNKETPRIGMLSKGHAVEVLGVTVAGWLEVVWGLSKSGRAYINNDKLLHKIVKDETPYMKSKCFDVGDTVQFTGKRLFRHPNPKSRYKVVGTFVGIVTEVSDADEMYYLTSADSKDQGWVRKADISCVPCPGYDGHKGEVTEDGLPVRVGPGDEFTKVQKWPQLAKGNVVDVIGIDKDDSNEEWYLVVIEGVKGYVRKRCVEYIKA